MFWIHKYIIHSETPTPLPSYINIAKVHSFLFVKQIDTQHFFNSRKILWLAQSQTTLILYLPDSEHSVPPLPSPWLVVYIYTGGSGTRFSPEKYRKYILIFCWPCILIYPSNVNQQDALFTFNLFQWLTSTCFEQAYCSSSGGTTTCIRVYVDWLLARSDPANSQST